MSKISEIRMREFAEKFAAKLVDDLWDEDIVELAEELDMTDDEKEYFGFAEIIENYRDDLLQCIFAD